MKISIPYGKEIVDFTAPDGFTINSIFPKPTLFVKDIYKKTHEAILNPINSPSLLELAKGKSSVCIVVTDITRECPDKELLSPLLDVLTQEVKKEHITILIAAGMHKKMSDEEKAAKYGKEISSQYKIIDHTGKDLKNLVNLGKTKNGTPIMLSKFAVEADLLIALGVVEPHQFAGFSGGHKTVSIGIAGDQTISHTHSGKMIRMENTRVGKIEGNPIQNEITEIGKKSGLSFIVNVVLGGNKQVVEIGAGEPIETHKNLVKKAREIYEIPVDKTYKVVICGVGFPKDSNLYQATRPASYLFFSHTRVIEDGGYIIIPAICNEGVGKGVGEQRFFSLLKDKSIDEVLDMNEQFKAGEQRAFFIANVLKKCKIIIVGSQIPKKIKEAKMIPAKNMDEAFGIIKNDFKLPLDVLYIPNSILSLPVIQ